MESEGGGRVQLSLIADLQCNDCDNELPFQTPGEHAHGIPVHSRFDRKA